MPPGPFSCPAPSPAAVPARLGPRGHPRRSAAWTCTARLGKVGRWRALGRRLRNVDGGKAGKSRLSSQWPTGGSMRLPPASVPRALAATRSWPAIRDTRAAGLGIPWFGFGCRVDGGVASGVCRATCRHTPEPDHVLPVATTHVNGGDDEECRRRTRYASSRPVVGVDYRRCPDLEATRRERTLPVEVGRQRRAGFGQPHEAGLGAQCGAADPHRRSDRTRPCAQGGHADPGHPPV